MKITMNDILDAIAEKILSSDAKKREIPAVLIDEVCKEKFGLCSEEEIESSIQFDGWNVYFALMNQMKVKSKEYGYTMRKAPLPKDMNWGMPYDFDYIFTPIKKDNKYQK